MKKLYLFLFSYLLLCTIPLHATTIVNGSLNNPGIDIILPSGPHNGETPLNWLQSGDDPTDSDGNGSFFTTSDVFDPVLSSIKGYSWVSSSDGGTFTHAIGMTNWQEGIRQTVTDLIPGQEYEITFEQSSSKSIWTNGTSGYWQLSFGNETHNAASIVAQDLDAWFPQFILFTAAATEQELSFLAVSSDGNRVDIAVDGIAISLVPEPSTILLITTGILGFLGFFPKRQS